MIGTLLIFLFLVLPVAAALFFAVSLVLYLRAKGTNRSRSGSYTPAQMKTRLVLVIVSGTLLGILLACIAALVVLLYTAVAFM